MSNEDLEAAYDDMCGMCDAATRNSNDGGKLPCLAHKARYLGRDVPVIRTTGLMDGEWTHTAVNTQSVYQFIDGILEEFAESDLSVAQFMHNLGVSVEWMPIDELEKVPEL